MYNPLSKIPKQIREDFHYLVDITCRVSLYAMGVVGAAILIGYLVKGCQNQEKHIQNSELEQTLKSNSIHN